MAAGNYFGWNGTSTYQLWIVMTNLANRTMQSTLPLENTYNIYGWNQKVDFKTNASYLFHTKIPQD